MRKACGIGTPAPPCLGGYSPYIYTRGEVMGVGTESAILNQSKKAQGETNQRLESLIVEQQRTNYLLAQLLYALAPQQPQQGPPARQF